MRNDIAWYRAFTGRCGCCSSTTWRVESGATPLSSYTQLIAVVVSIYDIIPQYLLISIYGHDIGRLSNTEYECTRGLFPTISHSFYLSNMIFSNNAMIYPPSGRFIWVRRASANHCIITTASPSTVSILNVVSTSERSTQHWAIAAMSSRRTCTNIRNTLN